MNNIYKDNIELLSEKLGIGFLDKEIYLEALTHSSFYEEKKTKWSSNERLEFLGDSIIGGVISEYLFMNFPEQTVGELALLKSNLVSAESLGEIARRIGLGDCILLGKGEELSGARERISVLSDLYESIIAGVYFDLGFDTVRELILSHFELNFANLSDIDKNSKSALQEKTQAFFKERPIYLIKKIEGPPHSRIFFADAFLKNILLGSGSGKTKKEAELSAAAQALESFESKIEFFYK